MGHLRRFAGKKRRIIRERTLGGIYEPCERIYRQAELMNRAKKTSFFDVDHIIPLRGEFISGLHVPSNLKIIPRNVNNSKSNKYDYWWLNENICNN